MLLAYLEPGLPGTTFPFTTRSEAEAWVVVPLCVCLVYFRNVWGFSSHPEDVTAVKPRRLMQRTSQIIKHLFSFKPEGIKTSEDSKKPVFYTL